MERYGEVLKRGAVLIDENDAGDQPRLLFYLEHSVVDGRVTGHGEHQVISTRMQFVDVRSDGTFGDAGYAPYLDCRAATADELALLQPTLDAGWMRDEDWDHKAVGFAIRELVPKHVEAVKAQRLPYIEKVENEVKARLQKEINHWQTLTEQYKLQEAAGKKTRLAASEAANNAHLLTDRLQRRMSELQRERAIAPQPPRVIGGALIVPGGLLRKLQGVAERISVDADARSEVERLAMHAVMASEAALGRIPKDVSALRGIGYDIESTDQATGQLYFIEVKGRAGADDHVTLSRSEIICALNEPDRFRLALVVVEAGTAQSPVYVQGFDFGQPGFAQTSSTYSLGSLLARGGMPS